MDTSSALNCRNLERKARCADLAAAARSVQGLGARYQGVLEQTDVYFHVPHGRFKLRTIEGQQAVLIGLGPLNDLSEMGLLIENLLAGHLHALSQQTQVRIYHWRQGNDEVDLIYDHPERPLAFEIGSSASHHRRGLQAFMQRFPRFKGRVFLVAPDLLPRSPSDRSEHVGTLPLDLLLLALGAQAEKELMDRLAV